jgi:hypothetical protein
MSDACVVHSIRSFILDIRLVPQTLFFWLQCFFSIVFLVRVPIGGKHFHNRSREKAPTPLDTEILCSARFDHFVRFWVTLCTASSDKNVTFDWYHKLEVAYFLLKQENLFCATLFSVTFVVFACVSKTDWYLKLKLSLKHENYHWFLVEKFFELKRLVWKL